MAGMCLLAVPVQAHEHREVGGKYTFVVGFVNEPAFVGQMNGVDLRVTDKKDKPVEGLEGVMDVVVTKDGKGVALGLRPRYKDPGRYAAYFLPTAPGTYTFTFEGAIHGVQVKETFESGNDKFHGVEQPVAFPG